MGLKDFGVVPSDMVLRIRNRFQEIYQVEKDLIYEEDFLSVLGDDWQIQRFVISSYKNEEEALNKLVATVKWRKANMLRELKENYFPREFYELRGIFRCGLDKQGSPALWIRVNAVNRKEECLEALKRMLLHQVYLIDEVAGSGGFVIVMDFDGVRYSALQNLDLLHFFITSLHQHFPAAVNYAIMLDVPWFFRTTWQLVKYWIPEKRRDIVQFTSHDQLKDFFPSSELPVFYGGSSEFGCSIPEGSPSLVTFCKDELELDDQVCQEILDFYNSIEKPDMARFLPHPVEE